MSNIKTIYYLIYKGGNLEKVEGRPIGLINRNQFYNLYNDPKRFVRKLLSRPPVSLNDMADACLDIKQHRFVFSTMNEKFIRRLFVSSELSRMSAAYTVNATVVDIEMVDINNRIITVESKLIG